MSVQRILIVDHDPRAAHRFASALWGHGYRVFAESNPRSALSRVRYEMIDLVISDILMPQMSGEELVYHVRQLHPALPAVFVSAHRYGVRIDPSCTGPTLFLPKPVSCAGLVAAVEELLPAPDTCWTQRYGREPSGAYCPPPPSRPLSLNSPCFLPSTSPHPDAELRCETRAPDSQTP